MIDSRATADVSERFERIGAAADAITAARTRDAFARWLESFFDLDRYRVSDLVLAINEALANSAEHAYARAEPLGTTDIHASYDPAEETLTVTVADQGEWRLTDSAPASRSRGRGIPLMTALSDRADIETGSDGTLVSLAWAGVHRR